jgi:hypothetical protein
MDGMTDWDDFANLLKVAGIAAPAGAFVAWAVFRYLGKKWLDARFEERLQRLKHEQNAEIEHVRFRINEMLDRRIKLHQKSLEVLPLCWAKAAEAFQEAHRSLAALRQYPDIGRLDDARFEAFLEASSLHEVQKDELRSAADPTARQKRFQKISNAEQAYKAKVKLTEFQDYLFTNKIFMSATIKDLFDQLQRLLADALLEDQINGEVPSGPREHAKRAALFESYDRLFTGLETEISRHFSEGRSEQAPA